MTLEQAKAILADHENRNFNELKEAMAVVTAQAFKTPNS